MQSISTNSDGEPVRFCRTGSRPHGMAEAIDDLPSDPALVAGVESVLRAGGPAWKAWRRNGYRANVAPPTGTLGRIKTIDNATATETAAFPCTARAPALTCLADWSRLVTERHAHKAPPNAQRWSTDGALIDTLRIGSDFVDLKADPAAGFPVGYEDGVATMLRPRMAPRINCRSGGPDNPIRAPFAWNRSRSVGRCPALIGMMLRYRSGLNLSDQVLVGSDSIAGPILPGGTDHRHSRNGFRPSKNAASIYQERTLRPSGNATSTLQERADRIDSRFSAANAAVRHR